MPRRLPLLDERTKGGIDALPTLLPEAQGVAALAQQAVQYLKDSKSIDTKSLQAEAANLGITDTLQFEQSFLSISNVYWQSAKARLHGSELSKAMMQFTLTEEYRSPLVEVYTTSREDLLQLIAKLTGGMPHYHDLDWRIDVELSTRARFNEIRPVYMLRLDTTGPRGGTDDGESFHLQADCATLKHVLASLDAAVREIKSTHCQRFARYIR